ncbi:ADAPTIN, ALPHA/GAMMA/EPSILON domain conatining protein,putative [Babesia bigemina]|uniref:AP-2 complex subunit alpha n=1 Tax=Babesia bigemina TaxID=5866 RepID=A0A061D4R0_BABBI|nr:ADAPTIN, ALPHA/GAMMA/EPSILON domain conatining protein,putative [Babesia bigemina]CDR95558.1 ADAPTIN, ALPHA/GAMMA/EPSILON domain conatining protein,putative [Babesia bigemina]|eukprot:XP_012767744.1 ADAPTIN, ALPHA/GAMMA/EPSILON domain conatining protein,putative [Babesia bigemina]
MAAQPVRGLVKFITDLNGLATYRERDHRVREELSKIHSRFDERGMSGYEKKKCMLKLLYIHLLGYDVDLGHVEAVQLMASSSYQEKAAGYMGVEVLLGDLPDLRRMAINTTLEDLQSAVEHVKALALSHVANSWCEELRERIFDDVLRMLKAVPIESSMLRKKLYMCVLQFLRLNSALFRLHEWKRKMFDLLSQEADFGCLMALSNLLIGFVRLHPGEWDHCVPLILEALMRLLSGTVVGERYYSLNSPWLLWKLLNVLALVEPCPNARYSNTLNHVVGRLVDRMLSIKLPTSNRPMGGGEEERAKMMAWLLRMSIALESVRVIVVWLPHMPSFSVEPVVDFLTRMLASQASHVYINALEMAEKMLENEQLLVVLKERLPQFLALFASNDPTVKCRTLFVVSHLCDKDNWNQVIPEMLSVLRESDVPTQNYAVPLLLDALQRCVPLDSLYIDFVFKMMQYVHDESVLQGVPAVLHDKPARFGELLASRCISALRQGPVNDAILRICAASLGEYGHLIEKELCCSEQARLLQRYFPLGSGCTQCVVLTTLARLAIRDRSLWEKVERFLDSQAVHPDVCVQSTACELVRLMLLGSSVLESVVNGDHGRRGPADAIESVEPKVLSISDVDESPAHNRNAVTVRRQTRAASASSRASSSSASSTPSSSSSSSRSHSASSSSSATPTAPSSMSFEDEAADGRLLRERMLSDSPGPLFDDGVLSVWVEQAYRRHEAKVMVRITVSARSARAIRCIHITSASLRCDTGLDGTEHNSVKGRLGPGEEMGHRLSFVLNRSYGELPSYKVRYVVQRASGRKEEGEATLRLPVGVHKFLTPLIAGEDHFDSMWSSLRSHESSREISVGCSMSAACEIVRRCARAHVVEVGDRGGFLTASSGVRERVVVRMLLRVCEQI